MFVHNMIRRADDAAIVQAMITMAKGFDMRVVAEGVETKEQLSYLLNRRCTEMQGFFLGKPLPAPSLSEFSGCSTKARPEPGSAWRSCWARLARASQSAARDFWRS